MSRAWVPSEKGARPRYGDVFRAAGKYHMGVSLDFEGDEWHTIESGQKGSSSGYDMLRRKHNPWSASDVLGWVDMETLLSETTPVPYWLGGWWKVSEASSTYYYYFDADNWVYYTQLEPLSRLFPPGAGATSGQFSIVRGKFRTVEIRWRSDDVDESFQVVSATGQANQVHPTNDKFNGMTYSGLPIHGERMPGPKQT